MDQPSGSAYATPMEELSAIVSVTNSANAVEGRQKRKRNRPILSCLPCHERKQQCSRGNPCTRCVIRRTPDECKYYEKPVHRPGPVGNSDGVAQLVQSTLQSLEPTTIAGLQTLLQLVQAGNAVMNTSGQPIDFDNASTSRQAAEEAVPDQLSQQNSSKLPLPLTSHGPVLSSYDQQGLADLQNHFPNHTITSRLLAHFFAESTVPWLWDVIDKPMFDNCYHTFSMGHCAPSMDFIALLAMVCAISLQFLPETPANSTLFTDYQHGRGVLKERMYDFSCSILLHNPAPVPSLERIQALILLSLFQLNEGNVSGSCNSSAAAIRLAHSLRMNRCATGLSKAEADIHQRVWWTLFNVDRFQSYLLNQPFFIHEQHCDVEIPNVYLTALSPRLRPDTGGSFPTEPTFHALQNHWARLVGDVWSRYLFHHASSYRYILDIECQIETFESNIPPSMRSTSISSNSMYSLVQSHVLAVQPHHLRILLLRPSLLKFFSTNRQLVTEPTEAFHQCAAQICISSCKRLLAFYYTRRNDFNSCVHHWASSISKLFDVSLSLIIASLVPPRQFGLNDDLGTWISMAHSLLCWTSASSTLALSAARYVEVMQNYARLSSHSLNNASQPLDIGDWHNKATHTLAEDADSVAGLLNKRAKGQEWLSSEVDPVYEVQFPGFQAFCDGKTSILENFMERYCSS